MDKKIYFVIMAAGSGSRMGAEIPKQFLPLKGIPILRRTIEKVHSVFPGARIVTVLPKDSVEEWRKYCLESNLFVPQIIVEGGFTRFHSVQNALSKVPDGAIVAIHDSVRPLISEDLLRRMVRRMEEDGIRALVPVVPCVDTLKLLDRGDDGELHLSSGAPLDRSRVFGAQTPQMFFSEDLKEAYRQPFDVLFTDDASVAVSNEIPLSFIEGERYNIKITTPDDLTLAEAILEIG